MPADRQAGLNGRILTRTLVIFSALFVLCSVTNGQKPAEQPPAEIPHDLLKISGTLRTGQGVPVPGATIAVTGAVTGESSGRNYVTWSDASGTFELPGLSPGRYHLQISLLGFESVTSDVQIDAGMLPRSIDLILHPAAMVVSNAPPPSAPAAGNAPADTPPSGRPGSGAGANAPGARRGGPGGASTSAGDASSGNAGAQNRRQAGGPAAGGGRGLQVSPDVIGTLAGGGQGGAAPTPDASSPEDISSSDAFVMSGTVGRATTAGADFSYSDENGGGPGRGGPGGGPGGGGRGGGPGGVGGGARGQGGLQTDSPGGGFGQGTPPVARGARMLRLAANKTRISFYERYGSSVGDAKPYSLTGA